MLEKIKKSEYSLLLTFFICVLSLVIGMVEIFICITENEINLVVKILILFLTAFNLILSTAVLHFITKQRKKVKSKIDIFN